MQLTTSSQCGARRYLYSYIEWHATGRSHCRPTCSVCATHSLVQVRKQFDEFIQLVPNKRDELKDLVRAYVHFSQFIRFAPGL
jgi:hypothetical protein